MSEERRDGHSKLVLDKGEGSFKTVDPHPHPVEILWREIGLPEYFLGNGGTNTKLYALYDRIRDAARIDGLTAAAETIGNLRQSEAGLFDAKHSGQRGADRLDALYDVYRAVRGLATQPGKAP